MMWGKSIDEKKSIIDKKHQWNPWYCWYPVKLLNGRWVWLEEISRKLITTQRIDYEFGCKYYVHVWTYDVKLEHH